MIETKCPSCLTVLRITERLADRMVRCPICRNPILVPSASEDESPGLDERRRAARRTLPSSSVSGRPRRR